MKENIYQYGIICEDIAQKTFIKHFIDQVCKKEKIFENHEFNKKLESLKFFPLPRKKIINKLSSIINIGFTQIQVNFFIIVLDADCYLEKDIQKIKQEIIDTLNKSIKNSPLKYIRVLPVQCIEHWYWYLKDLQSKPHSLETQPNPKAKEIVYNGKKGQQRIMILEKILSQADWNFLRNSSSSFSEFFKEMQSLELTKEL